MSSSSVTEPNSQQSEQFGHPGQKELARVLGSTAFARATRLCAMLTYVVEHSITQRTDELTEQQIGIHVFGRPAGFNSSEDTIVRGTARLLRQRLDQYYREEGRSDPTRITVPKGSYVARFEQVDALAGAKPSAEKASVVEHAPLVLAPPRKWPISATFLLAALCVGFLVATILLLRLSQRSPTPVPTGPQALWNALFTPGRKTLLVPGDASLDAFVTWEQRPVPLDEYSNQSYVAHSHASLPPHANDVPLAARSVTPMADLRLVSELVRVPEHMGRPDLEPWIEIRYARDVAVGDTHDNNLILIGSESFNPWVSLYKSNMDFYAQHDFNSDVYTVLNRAPQPGEQPRYEYTRGQHTPPVSAYTHLAYLDNSQGSGKVFIIEGTSMGTTYAALTFLTQEQLWRAVIDAAIDKSGRLHPFEVLLSSQFVRGGLTNTKRIAFHVH